MTVDVFNTRVLRERVLGTWRMDPARLREDANTEEDHARGYYRDRVVVELAQNAADAAARQGRPGRLLFRLTEGETGADGAGSVMLIAANTGAPVDAAGVASMAAMRASSSRDCADPGKRDDSIGHFGVGFSAVRAVADVITVATAAGAIRFSALETADAVAALEVDALTEELYRRSGSVPALRLPAQDDSRNEPGYDTTIRLTLRDGSAVADVRRMLAEVGDPLLLALPALDEIVVEDELDGSRRRIAGVDQRWRRITATGELAAELTTDRPVEERNRRGWRITWAVPRGGDGQLSQDNPRGATFSAGVVHAPTPTDDPLTTSALLVATLPLDPTRRHVARSRVTEVLLDFAADLYARLAEQAAQGGDDALALVPIGVASGWLDAELRERITPRLAEAEILPTLTQKNDDAAPKDSLIAPNRAVALSGRTDPALAAALSAWFTGLVTIPVGRDAAARMLDIPLREAAELIGELPTAPDDPLVWHRLYAALAELTVDPRDRESLSTVPVPLADGGMARGARGLLLTRGGDEQVVRAAVGLRNWGLRFVHPQAAHDVLQRLGAVSASPKSVLAHPGLWRAVMDGAADDDPALAEDLTAIVLNLMADTEPTTLDELPLSPQRVVFGLLTLRDDEGEWAPAQGLVIPGSRAAELLDHRVMGVVAADQVERWGEHALAAIGVRTDLVVLNVPDQVATRLPDELLGDEAVELLVDQLDGWDEYLAYLAEVWGEQTGAEPLLAVADLDAIDPNRWESALTRLVAPGLTRRALLDPAVTVDRSAPPAPSYTAWWLRTRSGLVTGPFAATGADERVAAVLPAPPLPLAGVDGAAQQAMGGVLRLDQVPSTAWESLLPGLADSGGRVDPTAARAVWSAWGSRVSELAQPSALSGLAMLPAWVTGARVHMVHADQAAVASTPMWMQRTDVAALIPVPSGVRADGAVEGAAEELAEGLAELLELPLVSELADGVVDRRDIPVALDTPTKVLELLPNAPVVWWEHEELRVDGAGVDWWVEGCGPQAQVHAVHVAGLARGLAQAAGVWSLRHQVELVLADPERAAELEFEMAFDEVADRE